MALSATPELDEVETSHVQRSGAAQWLPGRQVAVKDRMFFTEQLALLTRTAMPMHKALANIRKQVHKPAVADLLEELDEDIEAGRSLSEALRRHPRVFSASYVNLIAASEQGGFLADVLDQLHAMDEQTDELRSTLISAFIYPVFLLSFSFLSVAFVLMWVFPRFGQLFDSIRDDLPATTLFLLSASDVLIHYWPAVLAGTAICLLIGYRWFRSPRGKAQLDRIRLATPLIGDVEIRLNMVTSFKVISMSLTHGVSVPETLRACQEVVSNGQFKRLFSHVRSVVDGGGSMAEGFAGSSLMPDLAMQMISTADEAGQIGPVLGRMAEHYQKELNRSLTRLSRMIEPIMLLLMGLVVGVIVSSLILPIFQLSRAVH